ncbi:ABC transporter substrate-binding protein [Jannaschia sp. 2305UL9-9]|uniref:ABC transporter substrate-binding protein n=1 Tax=Jannaschia sp. 2305UL9-9 TaxID=3121638 RepID=UPI0035286734
MLKRLIASTLLAASALAAPATAQDLEKVTYLYPAPDFLPAFTPFQIARAKGYYEEEGLDVDWQVGQGGADVAKQVAVGNADLGGAIGDTPIIVRANGLPVKGVLLLGGSALTQLVIRDDSGATDMAGLAGKRVGVMAYQDTTYYNFLGAMAASEMDADSVDVQAVGPAGMVQLMISGDLDAISGTPDWTASIEAAGVPVTVLAINDMFPAMAQAVLASDRTVAERPEIVGAFVAATLRGLDDVMTDPAGSAEVLAAALPQFEGKAAFLQDVMERYGTLVYATEAPTQVGAFDPARVQAVADFYLANDIVAETMDIDDYFTNQFIPAAE